MMTRSGLSPFQFSERDGMPHLAAFPGVKLETVEGQGTMTGRDWQTELGMPTYHEEWEALAKIKSDRRHGDLKFVLLDGSPTNLPGHPRLNPKLISLPTVCSLELAHSGFIVGFLYSYVLGIEDGRHALPLGLTIPTTEGDFVIGCAQFVDSALADKAVEGLKRKIFSHVCPTIYRPDGAPDGSGAVLQVSLVCGDYPSIQNARIFSWSTA